MDDEVPGVHVAAHEEEDDEPAAGVCGNKIRGLRLCFGGFWGGNLHADGAGRAGG